MERKLPYSGSRGWEIAWNECCYFLGLMSYDIVSILMGANKDISDLKIYTWLGILYIPTYVIAWAFFRRTILINENGISLNRGLFFRIRQFAWIEITEAHYVKTAWTSRGNPSGTVYFIRRPHVYMLEGLMPGESFISVSFKARTTYLLLREYVKKFGIESNFPEPSPVTSNSALSNSHYFRNNSRLLRIGCGNFWFIIMSLILMAAGTVYCYVIGNIAFIPASFILINSLYFLIPMVLIYYKVTEDGIQERIFPGIALKPMIAWEEITQAGFFMDDQPYIAKTPQDPIAILSQKYNKICDTQGIVAFAILKNKRMASIFKQYVPSEKWTEGSYWSPM